MSDTGHTLWYLTRASGFVAYILLFATVGFGMLMSTDLVGRRLQRYQAYDLHRFLSLVTVLFTVLHILIVLPDGFFGFSIWQLLVPFASPYQPTFLALGGISFYLMLIVFASFYLRHLIGYRGWRTLHYLTFTIFLSALVHGIGAGADTSAIWAQETYLLTGIALIGLTLLRLFNRPSRGLVSQADSGPASVPESNPPSRT